MSRVVLDASAIAALYLPERYSTWVRKLVEHYDEYHILDLTLYELCNVLWKRAYLTRELRIDHVGTVWRSIKHFIETLCIIHSYTEVLDQALDVALKYGITVYDAAYITLARKLGVKLVTLDIKLTQKLRETDLHEILIAPSKS